jgi:hypothetical protein
MPARLIAVPEDRSSSRVEVPTWRGNPLAGQEPASDVFSHFTGSTIRTNGMGFSVLSMCAPFNHADISPGERSAIREDKDKPTEY